MPRASQAANEAGDDVGGAVDLPHRSDHEHRQGERRGDEGRGQQLIPITSPAGDDPRGEGEEQGNEFRERMGEQRGEQERVGETASPPATVATPRPIVYACMVSENSVAQITKASANGRPRSWTQRESPVLCAA